MKGNWNFFSLRLSEWSEDTLVMTHWTTIGLVSLIMVSIFCFKGHGICRPQPLFFYLKNSWQETKFQREPVSLIFLSSILVAILVMQILIEIKKRKFRRVAEKAARDAEVAKRNIDEAKLKIQSNKTTCNSAEINTNSSQSLQNQPSTTEDNNASARLGQAVTSSSNLPDNYPSQDSSLKVARAVTFFAVLPASVFICIFTLENIDKWRPHGTVALTMIAFGIVVPVLFFVGNSKLRKFVVKNLKNKLFSLKILFTSGRVEPLASI